MPSGLNSVGRMLHQSMNLNRFKKRERTQNWAYEEKRFLLELCKKDMSIIENKRLDADLTALKNRAWKIIHQEFTKNFGSERNCNRLKEQWRRMKACTRAEIMDYHHRLSRYGQEIADKKRPSVFTFEIWEFMQDAKKLCRSEALEGVDYSKVQLTLEASAPLQDSTVSDDDDEEVPMWQKATQNMCEVEMKEESSDDMDNDIETEAENEQNGDGPVTKRPYSLANSVAAQNDSTFSLHSNGNDDTPSLSINNMAATLDTLKLLKNGQFNQVPVIQQQPPTHQQSSALKLQSTVQRQSHHQQSGQRDRNDRNDDCGKILIEMQSKEHALRMEILQVQLQTAKFNRDVAEINKMIAMRNLGAFNGDGNHSED